MIIEIIYDYRVDSKSPALQSWTYFYVNQDDKTKAIAKAKTYFKKFCTEHGWTGKAKITGVDVIQKHDTLPKFITVPESELPPKRNVRDTKGNRTGVRQSKTTSTRKEPKVRRLSTKPDKSDEPSKSNRTSTSSNRRQTKPNQTRKRTAGK